MNTVHLSIIQANVGNYFKYTKKFKTLTSGDEPVINYEFQKNTKQF